MPCHRGVAHELGCAGCAKTTLVRAAISASGASCQFLTPAQLHSAYVGEGEAVLRAAFSTARCTAPSIIFIDELDTLAGSRDGHDGDRVGPTQLLTSLLTEIDGLENAKGKIMTACYSILSDSLHIQPLSTDSSPTPLLPSSSRFSVFSVQKNSRNFPLNGMAIYCVPSHIVSHKYLTTLIML